MYVSDAENSTVRGLMSSLDFTKVIEIEDARESMLLEQDMMIKSIDCRVLNGRKVSLRAEVSLNEKVYANEDIEVVKEVEDMDDLQTLSKDLSINSLKGRGNTKVYAKDTISIDAIDNLVEILNVEFTVGSKDTKVSYNKVLAKAEAEVKILYLTEDDRISKVVAKIPVMGFIDINDVAEEDICDMRYSLRNLLVKPNSIEEHSIYVEAELELSCMVYETKEVNFIQDLYSPCEELTFTQKNMKTMMGKQCLKQICNIREKVEFPEAANSRIYDVSVKPILHNQTVLKDRITLEGNVNLCFLLIENNSSIMQKQEITLPFEFVVEAPGVDNSSYVGTEIEISMQDFIVMPDGYIDTKIDLNFSFGISKTITIPVIDALELQETRQIPSFSIIIYFVKPGDTLWNIAKRFRSTVDIIAKVNAIEDPNKIQVGQQLFIPKYRRQRRPISA